MENRLDSPPVTDVKAMKGEPRMLAKPPKPPFPETPAGQSAQIVHARDRMPRFQQQRRNPGPNKSGAPGKQYSQLRPIPRVES